MSKFARRASVQISIAGKDVSRDLAPYLISFTYNDKSSEQVDDINLTLEDRDDLFIADWLPNTGETIECKIICQNWYKPGDKLTLDCGKFEIDEVTPGGPPSQIEIKAVSMLNANLRRELHNKVWESVSFEEVCLSIAQSNAMDLVFDAGDINIDRVDQSEQSDLAFLAKLCEDYGCKLKINDNTLFIYDEEIYEAKDIALVINRFEISKYKFNLQAHDVYKDCKVIYFDPGKKKTHKAQVKHNQIYKYNPEFNKQRNKKTKTGKLKKPYSTFTYPGQANINGGGKTLTIRARATSQAEAERLARAALRKKNQGEWVIDFSVMGNPNAMAGLIIEVEEIGKFEGIYMLDETNHVINKSGGYETTMKAHRVLGSWEQNDNAG